jgi:glutamate-1-semialdehyde 2,1-aminomutase
VAARHLRVGCVLSRSDGPRVCDLDGNWSYDLAGSYGVNLFGHEFYKGSIERGVTRAAELGAVLGGYHPVVLDNVARLRALSGLDEVSFHMSGTEAVMQAVRLARFHSGRSHLVRFCGAYHGWWDGVQAGLGNPLLPRQAYTLAEMDERTLAVIRSRDDIACVLVNPIQAMHPNRAPPTDSTLLTSRRGIRYDKEAYQRWLAQLREVCTQRGIALIFDEVFLGFRLARGGAQAYFGVPADLVTYGKSLGGGLPVGVVCGRRAWMRRFVDERPSEVCLARGTFNAHPYVMTAMNEFLRALEAPEVEDGYRDPDGRWDARAERLNRRLAGLDLPVRVANMTSVFATLYERPSRYHWVLQYYLRARGLWLSWIGTGRFIFPLDLDEVSFTEIEERFIAAALEMQGDGWWWPDRAVAPRALERRILGELITAGLGRAASGRATPPA